MGRDVRSIADGVASINFGPQSINRGQPSINFGSQSTNYGLSNINGEPQSTNRGLPNLNGEALEENRGVRSIRRGAQIINGVVPISNNLTTWMRFLNRLLPQAGPYQLDFGFYAGCVRGLKRFRQACDPEWSLGY